MALCERVACFGRYGKIIKLLVFCIISWYMGNLLGRLLNLNWTVSNRSSNTDKADFVKPNTVPVPISPKCNRYSVCPTDTFAFSISSGDGIKKHPSICLEDEILMDSQKKNTGRGINIVAVNASSRMVIASKNYDMWQGNNSGFLIKFIRAVPNGSLILMATFDEGSRKLNMQAKKEIEAVGSKLIHQISFRSSWAFLGSKGVALPENLNREKMIHKSKNAAWPIPAEIDGCISTQGT